MSSPKYPM
ncbi:hypothetical protein F383_32075 [Gossypium arboreum]|uniref:Uncharacterized protein n=1 Tax=Gossypium arboreum TaxID=29729 RepID=A0A0B0N253_GOSAR|nr:hypothetical protein F383_32075 [Gossypium arboreum]